MTTITTTATTVSEAKAFGGTQGVYRHASTATGTDMTFAVFVPEHAAGERLPVKVDAVIETVGRATWKHAVRSLRPGGAIIISGATSGANPDDALLTNIFFLQLKVIGSTMGTRSDLAGLVSLLDATGTRPLIVRTMPLTEAKAGFEAMHAGDIFGKVVFTL